jgi:uridylate kinase
MQANFWNGVPGMSPSSRYRRILLKISGESLCPPANLGLHREPIERTTAEITSVLDLGVQVAIVCGGGNFFRGANFATELGLNRSTADYMGMLGTVLNALALQEALERAGFAARVMSALSIARVCETFERRQALAHLAAGRVVLLAAGTGNPHVTTDSCAAMRGIELQVDLLLKATKVDGVYSEDPVRNPQARRYDRVSYEEVLGQRLRVMDISATEMCQQYNLPVVVFNFFQPGVLRRILLGEMLGTYMGPD